MENRIPERLDIEHSNVPESSSGTQALTYFLLAVLGFSFWFLMVVPFASHRESYGWLAGVPVQNLAQQFSFGQSSTYRPLAQVITWLGFRFLQPATFPTSVARQTLLQVSIYGMFLLAWWLIYSAAANRRLFALVACVTGGVFFSGYVHLFHIYGMFYVPVILTLAALIRFWASGTFDRQEKWFAVVAVVLAFWHPFATGLFMGFYFGSYLETIEKRTSVEHLRAIGILLIGSITILLLVAVFPRAQMAHDSRLLGFLVSYETNEVNRIASFVAFLLAETVVFSMELSPKLKLAVCLAVAVITAGFFLKGLPLLFIWFGTVLLKLLKSRYWSLFFLMLAAVLLPLGGGIGSPMYVLFAIVVATYVTPLGWLQAEAGLSFLKSQYVMGILLAASLAIVLVRLGIDLPIVTKVANPLLAERERTYQLEETLAWLHSSQYCNSEITFVNKAASPVEDVRSALDRQNRPPASLHDVKEFWDTSLRCPNVELANLQGEAAIITFGNSTISHSKKVFEVAGKYAGDTTVWVKDQ